MTVFVTGGCKNGKSTFALRQALKLAGGGPHYYIATLIPGDEEQRECVRKHQAARDGMGFETVECPRDLPPCPMGADADGTFLLDSVTALLMNELYGFGVQPDAAAADRVAECLDKFLKTVKHAVIVSDYIYADGVEYTPYSDAFVRSLAYLDRFLAARCDCVVEICSGIATVHKGTLPEEEKLSCI